MTEGEPIKFHPLANLFPLLQGEDYTALCRDVAARGLEDPITLYEDLVLDGRNRYRACLDTGTAPRFVTYEGADPFGFVVSRNLYRRHLTESQRALIARRLATLRVGRPSKNLGIPSVSQLEAAELLQVSPWLVTQAGKVLEHGAPAVFDAVKEGSLALSAAVELINYPEDVQEEVLTGILHEACGGKATATRIKKAVQVLSGKATNVHVSDDSYEWYTPTEIVEAARSVMGAIDLDPASSDAAQEVVRAGRYYTREDDGQRLPWRGRVFLNPPYSGDLVAAFTKKLREDHEEGSVTQAVLLVNNATDTQWFQALLRDYPVCLTSGRVRFWREDGEDLQARQGQAIFYLGDERERFLAEFSSFGTVVEAL